MWQFHLLIHLWIFSVFELFISFLFQPMLHIYIVYEWTRRSFNISEDRAWSLLKGLLMIKYICGCVNSYRDSSNRVLICSIMYLHCKSWIFLSERMKFDLCSYSGIKIYPGHGRTYVKADGKTFKFLNKKCERAFKMKRNPRKVNWTVLYR